MTENLKTPEDQSRDLAIQDEMLKNNLLMKVSVQNKLNENN